jgi:hypothetical protein
MERSSGGLSGLARAARRAVLEHAGLVAQRDVRADDAPQLAAQRLRRDGGGLQRGAPVAVRDEQPAVEAHVDVGDEGRLLARLAVAAQRQPRADQGAEA